MSTRKDLRNRKNSGERENEDEDEDKKNNQQHNNENGGNKEDLLEEIKNVLVISATTVVPGFTFRFVLLVGVLSFLHEKRPGAATGVVVGWLFLMGLKNYVAENRNLVNGKFIAKMLVYLMIYIIIGFLWSFVKLFLVVWRNHLSEDELSSLLDCQNEASQDCYINFLYEIKWRIALWVTYWPVNILLTLCEDPLRIVFDIGFRWAQDILVKILKKASEWLIKDNPSILKN